VVAVSEEPQPGASPDTPVSPDTPASPEAGQDVSLVKTTRLSDKVVGHLTDQARLTAQGAKARRVTTADGQPGVADLTPLRELFAELAEEMRRTRTRERIGMALRRAADIIDPPAG
jgi:hypothetical protein